MRVYLRTLPSVVLFAPALTGLDGVSLAFAIIDLSFSGNLHRSLWQIPTEEGTPTTPSILNVPPSFFSFLQNREEPEDLELYQSNSANSTDYTFRLCPIMWAPWESSFHKHSSRLLRKNRLVHSELLPQLSEATSYKYHKTTQGMEILNPDAAYS